MPQIRPVTDLIWEGPADATTVIEIGDYVYLATDDVRPFSAQADGLSEVVNQANAARNFLGVAVSAKRSTDAAGTPVRFLIEGAGRLTVTSSTFEIGDYLGPVEDSSGTALEDQSLKAVTTAALAVAQVLERAATATTKVWARWRSNVLPLFTGPSPARLGFPGWGLDDKTGASALAGHYTITIDTGPIHVIDPGGAARNVILPNEAASKGHVRIIHNAADAAEIITIQGSAGTPTVGTPTQNESAIVYCDGTTWRGLVGANN